MENRRVIEGSRVAEGSRVMKNSRVAEGGKEPLSTRSINTTKATKKIKIIVKKSQKLTVLQAREQLDQLLALDESI